MNLSEAASYWRQRLVAGQPIYRVRVRRLLELSGAERRGSNIMSGIRRTLESFDLVTEPDFQSVWPDSQVSIALKDISLVASTEANQEAINVQNASSTVDPALEAGDAVEATPKGETLDSPDTASGLIQVLTPTPVDPVARVSSIPTSKDGVVAVLLTDTIELATTKMSFDGYSQLAIMQNDREVRGMISWESIAKRSMITPSPTVVSDCRIDAQVVEAESSLYDALPTITTHGYVLVRSREKKITGIVTASDLAGEFGQVSYAFISLRTIEVLIRGKLHPVLQQGDLDSLEAYSRARTECDATLLTFGENVRLLQREDVWGRISVRVDKVELIRRLLEVRDIRNDVMHFKPEPLSSEQRRKLVQMESLLKQYFS